MAGMAETVRRHLLLERALSTLAAAAAVYSRPLMVEPEVLEAVAQGHNLELRVMAPMVSVAAVAGRATTARI